MFSRIEKKIRNIFFAGLLVTVPTMLTLFLLKVTIEYIDKVSAPIVKRFFNTDIPGIGFSVTIVLVFLIGLAGTNFIGKKLVSLSDWLLSKIPLVRNIYTSAKQIIETVVFATDKPFQQVVLVPYPRKDVYAIGLLTRKVPQFFTRQAPSLPDEECSPTLEHDENIYHVFIPSTPNFTSGLLVMFPGCDIIPLSMTVEEGFTYLMTGGILTPKRQRELEELKKLEEWELFLH
jgi:uncharacterized membrane protein